MLFSSKLHCRYPGTVKPQLKYRLADDFDAVFVELPLLIGVKFQVWPSVRSVTSRE